MKNNKIGNFLKEYRKSNHWSVEDVSIKLREIYGLHIAEKTIYGWESNQAHPTCDTFISLCELYQIKNLTEAFPSSTNSVNKGKDFFITPEERKVIESYRNSPDMQDAVKRLLNIEDIK